MSRSSKLYDYLQQFVEKILHYSLVVRFSKKYPKLYDFVLDRFSLKKFTGLPTTVVIILLVINLSLLTELGDNVQEADEIEWLDEGISNSIGLIRSTPLDKALYIFTSLASTIFINILVGCNALYLLLRKQYILIVGLATSWVGAGLTSFLGKNFYMRSRPLTDFYYVEDSYSFPSGHATLTIAVYGFLFYAYIIRNKSLTTTKIWWWVFILFVLLIGFSRVYLGVHFFSDVIGGYILGFIWLVLAIAVVEYWNRRDGK